MPNARSWWANPGNTIGGIACIVILGLVFYIVYHLAVAFWSAAG